MPTARHEKNEEKRHAMASSPVDAADESIQEASEASEEQDEGGSARGSHKTGARTGARTAESSSRGGTRRESRSFGSMISQSLAEESQQGVDRVLEELKDGLDMAKEYVSENPREAAGLAICAGAVAWALLGTKPGRKVFEAGAAIAVPYATKWVARNMADALR